VGEGAEEVVVVVGVGAGDERGKVPDEDAQERAGHWEPAGVPRVGVEFSSSIHWLQLRMKLVTSVAEAR
jgi:hypothetical protein